jgi:hypothetical protein
MNRYFKTEFEKYELIRECMDKKSGYPSNEANTWFAPAIEATKDKDGNILIAAMPAIAKEFIKSGVQEISEEEFQNLIPKQQLTIN